MQFTDNPARSGTLRFEYHFFLTRLKVLADSVLWSKDVGVDDISRLNNEVVRPAYIALNP